jgi:hypothetical protein
MDYEKIYQSFIADRKGRPQPEGYSESHHIIPRSRGGSDSNENLIRLTAREHYFAHCCLAKIHGGEMWAALHLMAHTQKPKHGATPFLMGRMFDVSRRLAAAVRSENMTRAWASGEFKRSRVYKPWSDDQKKLRSEYGKGRKMAPEAVLKARASREASAPVFEFVHVATGKHFRGTSLQFQAVSGVSQSHTSQLVRGVCGAAKGWVMKGNEFKPRGNRDRTVRIFEHRDGRRYVGTAYDFNAEHIKDSGMLSNCINGKNGVRTARGWRYVGEETKS